MIQQIFAETLTWKVLLYMIIGVAGGICIGALPGLTATMGVALLLPLTFGMDASQGILMLLGIYCGAIYGVRFPPSFFILPVRLRLLLRRLTAISWRKGEKRDGR